MSGKVAYKVWEDGVGETEEDAEEFTAYSAEAAVEAFMEEMWCYRDDPESNYAVWVKAPGEKAKMAEVDVDYEPIFSVSVEDES